MNHLGAHDSDAVMALAVMTLVEGARRNEIKSTSLAERKPKPRAQKSKIEHNHWYKSLQGGGWVSFSDPHTSENTRQRTNVAQQRTAIQHRGIKDDKQTAVSHHL